MTKRQLEIKVPNSLLGKLERHTKEKTSKTDVAIAALVKYFLHPDNFSLGERITTIKSKLAQV